IGQGKNLDVLKKLNKRYHFFDHIEVLPHPRWVMQYRRKQKEAFVLQYVEKLTQLHTSCTQEGVK
ncbi:MAG TPA: DUF4918 family protein, partial [Campylobacteraceae bacterium]|nr:DUF4918 family protein [Campylobacteraceae bacterium]